MRNAATPIDTRPSLSIIDILSARGFDPAVQNEYAREILYHCPLPDHDDRHPSFFVNPEKNVWHCFGCDRGGGPVELVALLDEVDHATALQTLAKYAAPRPAEDPMQSFEPSPSRPPAARPGCVLEEVADAKGLPVEHLTRCGWTTIPEYLGGPAVRIPYSDDFGEEKAVRFRTALLGNSRFRWKKGSKPLLYGLDRLMEARRQGYLIMVEGETDTVTLWYQGFPAVGVPGAGTWKNSWAAKLEKIDIVYLVVEPDMGGERLLEALSDSDLRDRLRVIRMTPDAKDMNALYLTDPAGFQSRVEALLTSAPSLHDRQMSAEDLAAAEELCRELAWEKDILTPFAQTVRHLGVAGEERAVKLLYLVLTSRYLSKPVPVVMKGVSSSGKSYLVQQVCRFFPESATHALSAMSEHALIRSKESFRHRFLVIYEAEGMASNFLEYLIRSLISEGHIRYSTLVETGEGWEEKTFEKEGPTGLILSTTRVSLHPENETRMFSVPTDDSPEQTTRIFEAMAAQEDRDSTGDDEMLAPWIALQTVIGAGPQDVCIPYLSFLSQAVDPSATRLRRDFTNLLSLIRANALLHQRSRQTDERGRIVASEDDYEQVYDLVRDLLEEGVQASLPEQDRAVVLAVKRLYEAGRDEVTIARLAKEMKRDQSVVRRRVNKAVSSGLLINRADSGKPYRIIPGDDLPEDRQILPLPSDLYYWMHSDEYE